MSTDLDAPEHALCSEALARRTNERDYYKDLWHEVCGQIADMCTFIGLPDDAMKDAWSLRDAIIELKAKVHPTEQGKDEK